MARRVLRSLLFIPTMYNKPTSAKISSHEYLLRSGLIRQSCSGIFSLLPAAWRSIRKIENIVDKHMYSINGQRLQLPLLTNSSLWRKTERWEAFGDELFKLKDRKGNEYCLAPTHEEIITDLVANEISSYRRLPLRLYQIGIKYRDEIRPRNGMMRTREFIMKDMYSFDVDETSAIKTYKEVQEAYANAFKELSLDVVCAQASSGNMGGTLSHEYLMYSEHGEDKVLRCPVCSYTANSELHPAFLNHSCTRSDCTEMHAVNGFELGHTFYLGTKYSDALGANILTEKHEKTPMVMGCYGLGISRIMSCIVEKHCDKKGINWPIQVAPYTVCIIPANSSFGRESEKIYDDLVQAGLCPENVVLDDRHDMKFGEKLTDAELIGYPICLIVGRDLEKGLIETRVSRAQNVIPVDQITSFVVNLHK